MDLNDKQREAAFCGDGYHRVLAGPGTGKTATLTARVAHLLKDRGILAPQIMVLTFTKKAAGEMKSRISKAAAGYHPEHLQIGTFHSVALQMLGMLEAKYPDMPRKRIITDYERQTALTEAGIPLEIGSEETLLDVIDRAKERMQRADEFGQYAFKNYPSGHFMRKAVPLYHQYESMMQNSGYWDFNDIILEIVEIMKREPKIGASFANFYQHILVDEYQDANLSQIEFLRHVSWQHKNLWAVGDDDQSLYGFRGANSALTLNFERLFPGAKTHTLTTNYRCPKSVVDLANNLISHNQNRHPKELVAHSRNDAPVRLMAAADDLDEADRIANGVGMLLRQGFLPNDNAILVRTARAAIPILVALSTRRIPFHFSRDFKMSTLPAYRDVIKAMEFMEKNPSEARGGGRTRLLQQIAAEVRQMPFDVRYSALCNRLMRIPPRTKGKDPDDVTVREWKDILGSLKELPVRTSTELKGRFKSLDPADSVAVMPIHSAKGLEWSNVFVAGVDNDQMPHPKNQNIEEERRVFFVGVTRAKNMLCVSYPLTRGGRSTGASPFVIEAFSNLPYAAVKMDPQISLPTSQPSSGGAPVPTKPAAY